MAFDGEDSCMNDGPHVGTRIRKRRQVLRMTQADLAGQLDVSKSTVANWETGKHFPVRYQGAIEQLLGISLDDTGTQPDPNEEALMSLDLDPAERDKLIEAYRAIRDGERPRRAG
jgi:transcriptional regulator with XRE-family HTH domain